MTPFTTPTAPAPLALQPFDVLDTCHQQMVMHLHKLGELIDHVEAHGVDGKAQELARALFLFFMNTAREHHQDEERHIFPTMIDSGDPELAELALRLQQDHGWIEEDWLELAPQIESIAAGYNWFNIEQLRLAVPVFQALYHDHIALEESQAYPEAKARIAAWDLQGMGREMASRRRQRGAALA
ncbi:MAG: hemerythrin domain-containing protein [Proteobacteria bacterium]|uniref:hemerythrin domain-containing protein n=1 Tax=Aquabacterium sp. TaxID=1872578 RepID=UPI0035C6A091|nr:hemerythrin domain-containing protein [Pseudomonadota bacterium]